MKIDMYTLNGTGKNYHRIIKTGMGLLTTSKNKSI
jgi:hypothetical protein